MVLVPPAILCSWDLLLSLLVSLTCLGHFFLEFAPATPRPKAGGCAQSRGGATFSEMLFYSSVIPFVFVFPMAGYHFEVWLLLSPSPLSGPKLTL